MQWLASLKHKLGLAPGSEKPARRAYDGDLQRRLQQLCQSLQKQPKKNKDANTMLADLLKPLGELSWDHTTHTGKMLLIQLGELLLASLAVISPAERFNYFKALVFIVARLEFCPVVQSVAGHSDAAGAAGAETPTLAHEELHVFVAYRAFVVSVIHYIRSCLTVAAAAAVPVPVDAPGHSGSNGVAAAHPSDASLPLALVAAVPVVDELAPAAVALGEPAAAAAVAAAVVAVRPAVSSVGAAPFVVQSFCAQALAVIVVRVPDVMHAMMRQALHVDQEELHARHQEIRAAEQMADAQREQQQQQQQQQQRATGAPGPRRHSLLREVGGTGHLGIGRDDVKRMGHNNTKHPSSSSLLPTAAGAAPAASATLKPFEDPSWFYLQGGDDGGGVLDAAVARRAPQLFGWQTFHRRAEELDRTVAPLRSLDLSWLDAHIIGRRTDMFQLFIKHWVEHVLAVQAALPAAAQVPFRSIAPFRGLVRNALLVYMESNERSRQLADAVAAVLSAEPGLVSFFVKALFLSTDATDFMAILDSLMQLESWFKQIASLDKGTGTLPDSFDYDFLCRGFDQLLSMDHHVINSRLLTIVYNNASVFSGDGRLKLFSGLLLEKHGYSLLLSWDSNTRSVFMQLLVFKLLRCTRRVLQSQPPQHASPERMRAFEQDRLLLTRQEALLRSVKRQLDEQDPARKQDFEPRLEVYAARMLEEFDMWMSRYNDDQDDALSHKLSLLAKGPKG